MFNKLKSQWKNDWWIKECGNVATEYQSRRNDLEKRLQEELARFEEAFDIEKEISCVRIESERKKIKLLEEEVEYRFKTLEERRLELIKVDNELKTQIKLLEAKASPSAVWSEAFSQGMSKCWDLALPFMQENIEKFKTKVKEDAAVEAIQRLKNAPNKK